jgi:hypothetical protein
VVLRLYIALVSWLVVLSCVLDVNLYKKNLFDAVFLINDNCYNTFSQLHLQSGQTRACRKS